MKILIKTPFVQNNKYLPHLLEHCLLSHTTPQQALLHWEIEGNVRTGYSSYESYTLPLETLIQVVTTPPTPETMHLEEQIIQKELRWSSYGQKYFEKILQTIENPKIITNKRDQINYQQLLDYHKKYYQIDNIVCVDEKWNLIPEIWKTPNLKTYQSNQQQKIMPQTFKFSFQGEKNIIITLPIKEITLCEVLLMDCFAYFLDSYFEYTERKNAKYPTNYLDFYITDQNYIFIREINCPKIKKKEIITFFHAFLPYFRTQIQQNLKRTFIAPLTLLTDTFIDIQTHLHILEQMDEIKLQSYLERFQL